MYRVTIREQEEAVSKKLVCEEYIIQPLLEYEYDNV